MAGLSGTSQDATFHTAKTPIGDTQLPWIQHVEFNGEALEDGSGITGSGLIVATAEDASGISKVEFYLDGTLVHTAYSDTNQFTWNLDINRIPDGQHYLLIKAYDSFEKSNTASFSLSVQMAPPPPPVIHKPSDNSLTNQLEITVAGEAEKGTTVLVYVNGNQQGTPLSTDANGHYQGTVTLSKGQNEIFTVAENRGGTGPESQHVHVTCDTSIPSPPIQLSTQSGAGGTVHLAWSSPTIQSIAGYNVYRSSQPFTDPIQATRLTSSPLPTKSYNDIPLQDGRYYYGVTAVNLAGTEGQLSEVVEGISDRTPPWCEITYHPASPEDPATGAIPQGDVEVVLSVSEPVKRPPFLSIVPLNAPPIPIELIKIDDLTYQGNFTVDDTVPPGTAYAVFSAMDKAGNRGTEVRSGGTLILDTKGPVVEVLQINVPNPIRNPADHPRSITVSIGLDEPQKESTVPFLAYSLSASHKEPIDIDLSLRQDPLQGTAETWEGTFTLPSDAGAQGPETLTFYYKGKDSLGNNSTTIVPPHEFQVYQGALPPLPAPYGLKAKSLPGGRVALSWQSVPGADGYVIWRRSGDDNDLSEAARTSDTHFLDLPGEDGIYVYAISSIRHANGQEAVSSPSTTISAWSDRTPPEPPQDLTLTYSGQGVKVTWDYHQFEQDLSFKLLRSDIPASSGGNATIIAEGIQGFEALDPHPSIDQRYYSVQAVDKVGNVSELSSWKELALSHLPVSSVRVFYQPDSAPLLTWTMNGEGVIGFKVCKGPTGNRACAKDLVTQAEFQDLYYNGKGGEEYAIAQVYSDNATGPAHSIYLPELTVSLVEGAVIKRGLVNRIDFQVFNNSQRSITHAKISLEIHGHQIEADEFSLAPHSVTIVPVTISGFDNLEDREDATIDLVINPQAGDEVRVRSVVEIPCIDSGPSIELIPDQCILGGMCAVRFRITNTGTAPLEFVTATPAGPSTDIQLLLVDGQDNILSQALFMEVSGTYLKQAQDGSMVAHIPSGVSYTSGKIMLPFPKFDPGGLKLLLQINHFYHNFGKNGEAVLRGASARTPVDATLPPYQGVVTSVSPKVSMGMDEVTIEGQTIDSQTSSPIGPVPVDLVLRLDGFRRRIHLTSDESGRFSYTYLPQPGESGNYTVAAVHPMVRTHVPQSWFKIERVWIAPTEFKASMPRGIGQRINFRLKAGRATSVQGLHVEFRPEDQPGGTLPQGISVNATETLDLGPNETGTLGLTIMGTEQAASTTRIVLRLLGNIGGQSHELDTIVGDIILSEARPVLSYSPAYIETGVSQGDTITESITLKNTGLAALEDIMVSLEGDAGGNAPSWISLATPATFNAIGPGHEVPIELVFSPPPTIPSGMYHLYIRVESSNHDTRKIGVYCSVTRSGKGNVLFKVEDIFSGTVDPATGSVTQGVRGAQIIIQNQELLNIKETGVTDSAGELEFKGLPAGLYKYRVTAPDHDAKIGRLWIKAGVNATETVHLSYNIVSIEWEVTERPIEDHYEINLHTTYVTDIPAAVVAVEPAHVKIPDMEAGDVFYGELVLTNKGLVRADDMRAYLPAETGDYHFEYLMDIPSSIAPHERVIIPYRVTRRGSMGGYQGQSSGGSASGCRTTLIKVVYTYQCINQHTGESWIEEKNSYQYITIGTCTAEQVQANTGTGTGTGGSGSGSGPVYSGLYGILFGGVDDTGGWIFSSGGGIGPSTATFSTILDLGSESFEAPSPGEEAISGVKCWPRAVRTQPSDMFNKIMDIITIVGCGVNKVDRTLVDNATDIKVKVSGGFLSIERRYSSDRGWWFKDFALKASDIHRLCDRPQCTSGIPCQPTQCLELPEAIAAPNGDIYRIAHMPETYEEVETLGENATFVFLLGPETLTLKRDMTLIMERWDGERLSYRYAGDWKWEISTIGNRTGALVTFEYDSNGFISRAIDRNGNVVATFVTDSQGRILSITDHGGRTVRYEYDRAGRMIAAIDPLGLETRYYYDAHGLLVKKRDPAGRETLVTYDAQGNVKSALDANGTGHFFDFDYDPSMELYYARIRTTSGRIEEYWYDRYARLKRKDVNGKKILETTWTGPPDTYLTTGDNCTETIRDEKGNKVEVVRDSKFRVRRIVWPNGTQRTIQYDLDLGFPSRVVAEDGSITEFSFNTKGLLMEETEAKGTLYERHTIYEYDEFGQVVSITRYGMNASKSATTEITYDQWGNISSVTTPEGRTYRGLSFDTAGNLLRLKDPKGGIWNLSYDAKGRLITVEDPLGHATHFEYNGANNLVALTNALSKTWRMKYNLHNKLVVKTGPYGEVSKYMYNADQKLIEKIDPEGRTTNYFWDNEGRLIKAQNGMGDELHLFYDESQASPAPSYLPVAIEDPFKTIRFYYDEMHNIVRKAVFKNNTAERSIEMRYDPANRLSGIIDSEGHETRIDYDPFGNPVKVIEPDNSTLSMTYTDLGKLRTYTDQEMRTTSFSYDKDGNLLSITRPMGETYEYEYNDNGDLKAATSPSGRRVEYAYDLAGRLIETRYYPQGNYTTPEKTISFSYDALNRLIYYTDGTTSGNYTYDANGRLLAVKVDYGSFSIAFSYTYYKNGLLKSFTTPEGITYTYHYDDANRLASIEVPGIGPITWSGYQGNLPGKILYPGGISAQILYDAYGEPISILVNSANGSNISVLGLDYASDGDVVEMETDNQTSTFGYDVLGRIIQAQYSFRASQQFSYDRSGLKNGQSDFTAPWTLDADGRLLYSGNATYSYDADGNLITKTDALGRTTHYTYDAANRLVRIWDDANVTIARYYYDPFGRRLWKEVDGVRTYYLYGQDGLIGEYDSSGKQLRSYLYRPGSPWQTNPVLLKEGGHYYWYVNDHRGAPLKLIDLAGETVWSAHYSAFGSAQIDINFVENNLRLPGQYYDVETGLHYNLNRYYDPVLGRYTQPDPFFLVGDMYSYAANSPVLLIDPEGKCVLEIGSGVALVISTGGIGTVVGGALVIHGAYGLVTTISNIFAGTNFSGSIFIDVGGAIGGKTGRKIGFWIEFGWNIGFFFIDPESSITKSRIVVNEFKRPSTLKESLDLFTGVVGLYSVIKEAYENIDDHLRH